MDELAVRLPDGSPLPPQALAWSFSRASGPGGQHVNRSATRVQLVLDLAAVPEPVAAALRQRYGSRIDARGHLTVAASSTRSQLQNRQAAAARLEEMIALALRPRKRRRRSVVPRGERERRLEAKKRRGESKRRRGGPMGEG